VLYYTPARVNGSWSQQHDAYVLQQEQLPFFIDSDWNLLSGTAAAGSDGGEGGAAAGCGGGGERCAAGPAAALQLLQPHALHFLVYVPPAGQRPLHVAAADGSLDATNSFWIPSWGGVVIENPAAAAAGGEDGARAGSRRQPLDDAAYQRIAGVAVAQLRALLGLPLTSAQQQRLELLPAPETGFALWEVEALLRQRVAGDVAAVSKVRACVPGRARPAWRGLGGQAPAAGGVGAVCV
jgi:phosphatidylinositol glycan class S